MPRVALTDRFVAAAKPIDGGQTDYFDENTRGLALRVGTSGRRAWTFLYTSPRDGKRARARLGNYPAMSLAGARTRALEAKGHLEKGTDPRDAFTAEASGALTVAGLLDSYLEKHVRPNLRSAPAIERRLDKNVRPMIGAVLVEQLHRRDVNRVLDPILARGRQVEAGRVFEDLRAAFRWAVARGDLEHAPTEGMKKPATPRPRDRVLSDDEIQALWNGLPKSLARSKSCQRIVKLCLVTVQRVGEVAGMRRDELDLDGRSWTLPGERTKNGHTHLVPLSDLAVSIVQEALADAGAESPFVFPVYDRSSGEISGALPPGAVSRTIGRAQETTEKRPAGRFGLDRWTAHDLRRTALTNFAKLGIAPIVAGAVANHITVTQATVTLRVYTRYSYDAEKRQALGLWAARLAAIVAGTGATIVPLRA